MSKKNTTAAPETTENDITTVTAPTFCYSENAELEAKCLELENDIVTCSVTGVKGPVYSAWVPQNVAYIDAKRADEGKERVSSKTIVEHALSPSAGLVYKQRGVKTIKFLFQYVWLKEREAFRAKQKATEEAMRESERLVRKAALDALDALDARLAEEQAAREAKKAAKSAPQPAAPQTNGGLSALTLQDRDKLLGLLRSGKTKPRDRHVETGLITQSEFDSLTATHWGKKPSDDADGSAQQPTA